MPNLDPRIDEYIANSAGFAQPILSHLRQAVHDACPEVEETIKWSTPFFLYQGMLCNMASFKAHCAFGFWKGELLVAQEDDKGREAMGQFGRITEHFSAFPPSAMREYVDWLAEAKTEATRLRRLEQAVEWIAEGKRRHWKYKNC